VALNREAVSGGSWSFVLVRGALRSTKLSTVPRRRPTLLVGRRQVEPSAPRGKRVRDTATGSFIVVGRAPNGQPEPYFDRARNVWVAPWRKPDGKVGRPTGRTRAAAEASRERHIATATEAARFAPLAEEFHIGTTLGEVSRWWLDNISRHRVRITTWTTYDKRFAAGQDPSGRHRGAPASA
jgi:hypothetical protein